jgi:copper chaperone CopZ
LSEEEVKEVEKEVKEVEGKESMMAEVSGEEE